MVMDIGKIMEALPHCYPFLLLDRVVSMEPGKSITAIKNVTINEEFFKGHFPGFPVMPGVLIVEAMAQVGGVLALSPLDDRDNLLVYFMGIDKAKFRKPVVPGDQLRMEITVLRLKTRFCKMRGEAFVDGTLVAEAEFTSAIVPKDESATP